MTVFLAGIDIGGTKCAVSLGKISELDLTVIDKTAFPTPASAEATINKLKDELHRLIEKNGVQIQAIGISCGGPLDSKRGMILSPPNLPGWDRIDIITPFHEHFGVPVSVQNDANACALAEWTWGAGKRCGNMVFLTFGTGMGAGIIINGNLYSGTNDMAGEVGHIRMEEDGPVGYDKAGSFEGFCSGGGITKLAQKMAVQSLEKGVSPPFCPTLQDVEHITTKKVGEAAQAGDPLALEIFRIVGTKLGRGLSILIDILNPEKIVIGSIYARQRELLEPIVMEELRKESLNLSLSVCTIEPAALEENVGDFAALSVAYSMLP